MTVRPLFKSLAGQTEYYHAYEASLTLWPIPLVEEDVDTRYGRTHVLLTGSPDASPLVLLHGSQASSTMWFPNIQSLAESRRVYAIDFILEAGKSVPDRMLASQLDLSTWLLDVFNHYGLHDPDIVGLSRGAWNATAFCLDFPHRIRRLVLLSPAQVFTPIRNVRFLLATLLCVAFPSTGNTLRMTRIVSTHPEKIPNEFLMQYRLALKNFNLPVGLQVPPATFTDEQLRRLSAPIQLLIGDRDVVNGPASIKRAAKLVANIQSETIVNAGHFVTFDQPAVIHQCIFKFLGNS